MTEKEIKARIELLEEEIRFNEDENFQMEKEVHILEKELKEIKP